MGAVGPAVLAVAAACAGSRGTLRAGRCHDLLMAFPEATSELPGASSGKPLSDYVHLQLVTCGGDSRSALFVHPPAQVSFPLRPRAGDRLRCAVGMDDATVGKSGGMTFVIEVRARGATRRLAAVTIDPGAPAPQRWHPLDLDLSPFAGADAALVLRTEAGADPSNDWGGFASPQVVGEGAPARVPAIGARSLLLVSLDTLRVDRLGAFGDPWALTPRLDRELRGCDLWPEARSSSHWTLPAHMSLFSGTHADVHGVDARARLSPSLPTLAERLHAASYRTLGFVADVGWLSADYGFGRGFDRYVATSEAARERIGRVREQVERLDDGRPLFLFVHFFDAHSDFGAVPYEASPEETWRCAPHASAAPRCATYRCASAELLRRSTAGERLAPAAEAALAETYGAGLADLDREVGRLLAQLAATGLRAGALTVLVSDHGEEMGDHGHYLHEQLHGEQTHALLALRPPGATRPGRLRAGLPALVDVAPTMLAFAGLSTPSTFQGVDLGAAAPVEAYAAGNGARALYRPGRAALAPADGPVQCYDLDLDPGEQRPLPTCEPALAASLRARRAADERLFLSLARGEAVTMSDEERARLKALGYND